MPILIGADVGGTKTSVLVTDGDSPRARITGAGAAIRPGRAITVAASVAETVRRALAAAGARRGEVLVVGAAGAGRAEERQELARALRSEDLAERVIVTTDIEIALEAAFGTGPGIVLVAGTGSVALARDAAGELHRSGGHGWQMGDEGSGYDLGRRALRAVGRTADGRSEPTALTEALLAATRSADLSSLVRWASTAGAPEVASLARAVQDEAERGDGVATTLVRESAEDLVRLVESLLPRFPEADAVSIALSGGLLGAERPVLQAVLELLAAMPRARAVADPVDAAAGAVALGRRS